MFLEFCSVKAIPFVANNIVVLCNHLVFIADQLISGSVVRVLLRQANKLINFQLGVRTRSYCWSFRNGCNFGTILIFFFYMQIQIFKYKFTKSNPCAPVQLSNQVTAVLAGLGSSVPDTLLNPNEKYKLSQLLCHVFLWAQSIKPALADFFPSQRKSNLLLFYTAVQWFQEQFSMQGIKAGFLLLLCVCWEGQEK